MQNDTCYLEIGVRNPQHNFNHIKANKKYSVCTCGKSDTLPYCDNSHRILNKENGTNYKSFKVFPEEDTTIWVSSSTWENTGK